VITLKSRSVALTAVVSILGGAATAATLEPLDLNGLVGYADTVVYGRVVDATPVWVMGGRQIDTLVTLEVGARLKGDTGSRVTFRVPGGRLGGHQTVVPGAPSFVVGDEVVTFLARGTAPAPEIVGLAQGALPVAADAQGRRLVQVPVMRATAAGPRAAFVTRSTLSLMELGHEIALISQAAAAGRGRP
jgi:hypothetical protein